MQGHKGGKRGQHVAMDGDVDVGPPPEFVGGTVHLGRARAWKELVIRKIGAEQDQQVRVLDALGGGTVAQQARHADVVRVVVLHEVLAPERMADRRPDQLGQGDHLIVGALHAGSREDGNFLRRVDCVGQHSGRFPAPGPGLRARTPQEAACRLLLPARRCRPEE